MIRALLKKSVFLSPPSFSSYGTVLYINTVEHTPDGRSLITTTGEKRFEVLERGGCDGYSTVRIRFIVDEPITDYAEIGECVHFTRPSDDSI